jgi:hypothetical protein
VALLQPLHTAINGSVGADTLTTTGAGDMLTGGAGDDVFVIVPGGSGHDAEDVIVDFGATYFAATVSGTQEVPANASTASGTASGWLARGSKTFDFTATVQGLDLGGQTASTTDNVTASHFHAGAIGVSGGVVYGYIGTPNSDLDADFTSFPTTGTIKGQWDANEGNNTTLTAQLDNLLNNRIYINFHTSVFPAGEIRGQMIKQDTGNDKIDLRQTSFSDFTALMAATTDVNGSATIAFSGGYSLTLQGVAKASLTANDFVFASQIPSTLSAKFANIHLGRAATPNELTALAALQGMSAAAQDRGVIDTANADTAVAEQAYYYFFGKTPTADGLAYLTNSAVNTTDLNDAYYAKFSTENRYINFVANLGVTGPGSTFFSVVFGGQTFAKAVEIAYGQIIGFNYAQAAGINATAAIADITGRQAYFQAVARDGLGAFNQDLAAKAAMVGYIMSEGIKADVGAYATASNAFMTDLFDGTAQHNVNLIGVYAGGLAPTSATGQPIAASAPFEG